MAIPYPIEDLVDLATVHNVELIWYPQESAPRGRYVARNGVHVIFLSPILQRSEMRLRCTLAHELGHHSTGAGGERIDGEVRDEARADRWARRLLMPDEWMLDRLTWPVWEIAEHAGVLQSWAEARLADMERMLSYA